MTNQVEITNEQSYGKVTGAIIASFAAIWIFGLMPILNRPNGGTILIDNDANGIG